MVFTSNFVLVLFLVWTCGSQSTSKDAHRHIVAEFSDPMGAQLLSEEDTQAQFNNLVVDKNTGRVYIGGVNKLYQLSPKLEVMVSAETGPKYDSPECSVQPDCQPSVEKKLTNNHNKALVLDYIDSRMIDCGSLFQGICTVRSLRNISIVEALVKEPVSANNATASTVAFIAPGPPNPPITQVLYVGVTWTGNGPFRSEVPAVSSRSLDSSNLFQIAQTAVTTGTRMFVNSLARERYPINYVYGFASEGFSYFLTTQMKRTSHSPYVSKIVRVCHDDQDYYSYTEVPLQCISDTGEDYTLVQAAYVGKPINTMASRHPVPDIEAPGSDLAAELGVTAQDDVLFAVFSTPDPSEGEDFCGLDVNTPLGGEEPIQQNPVLKFGTQLTSVVATSTGDLTVAFIGTADGHLKKAVIESATSGIEYGDIPIAPGTSVQGDLLFDLKRDHIYVMTDQKLSKVRVQDCAQYQDCGQCLGSRDPYCGWCSLENKCSLKGDCRKAGQDPLYWISYKTGRCTTITSVTPHQLQRTTARTLQLVIDNLPNLPGQFYCAFAAEGKVLPTNATRTKNGVSCTTPRNDMLPVILHPESYFTSVLSVRVDDGPNLVSTNFTFFDCNAYGSCTECVASPFPCDWCVERHRCTHDSAENCRNDMIVNGVKRIGTSLRSGPDYCPRVNSTANGSPEILVSAGLPKSVRVKVDNIAPFISQTRFVCQFNIEGRVHSVTAGLISDTIYCDELDFTYANRVPNITATFAVIWGQSKPLDNPENIHVLIYRCEMMADNCGMCLSLDEKYNCGWCEASKKCEVKEQCGGKDYVSWLDRDQTCPEPQITSFSPEYGPWEGGTNITINGVNLGKTFDDISGGVTVAGMACAPYPHLYEKTKKIVCKVDGPGIKDSRRGPILIKIKNFRGESRTNYTFIDPVITDIEPRHGPQSGGTKIRIKGEYLNAGSHVEAYIGNYSCRIIKTKKKVAVCVTSRSPRPQKLDVSMQFDHGKPRVLERKRFEYVQDPTIEIAFSGTTSQTKIPRGIPSGGVNITVVGTDFQYIQEPSIYVLHEGARHLGPCQVATNTMMYCQSPAIDTLTQDAWTDLSNPTTLRLDYGFIMDNVESVQNLSKHKTPKVYMFPDPEFNRFADPGGVKVYKSDYLTLDGNNLNRAAKSSDYLVQIGTEMCNVTSVSLNQLTCKPPDHQPAAMLPDGSSDPNQLPDVVVMIGEKLRYTVGKLDYNENDALIPTYLLIILIALGAILIIITMLVLIAYRRKSSESVRVLKNMQEQMDVLELRVAAECKEAFAELQTEITEIGCEVQTAGIPFLDYRTYCIKILFPGIEDHTVLQWDRPDLQRKDKGLRLFGQLVMNKTFLLLFIRTLESNRYFSMRDRVNVASLIMVTLQSRMEYCTEILKTLLADLIERCMEGNNSGKSHPKLLLRRTESVAEKMLSAWFTFLLYKFLHECAGEPLYMLYQAIKHQVNKGPVDFVSHEARYSLSEEKLIRQQVEFRSMTVFVSMSPQTIYMSGLDPHGENMDIPVRVLDCDTITQVKDKSLDTIYRAISHSQRPKHSDLDLEWRTGQSGRLILYDEDSTTKTEGDWKRINTLSHYRVPDGALLTLIPKQSSMYNISTMSDKSDRHLYHKYETLNMSKMSGGGHSPPLSRATSPLNHDFESGIKMWHLVRHDTDNNKDERSNKLVSEIYLTRLLATKGTVQKFVDDLFETIFSTAHRGSALPLAIKYLFDFLDDQALQHGIQDSDVVHTWKSNSLPLRFWVNLIKNPNFVFDLGKSNIVDSCLSVVAQTFMDACSTSEHQLGKDSPSSKLLYAKDIPIYKDWVTRYYQDIKHMPAISDQDMNAMLAEESRIHANEFNLNSALHELYTYAVKYNEQLLLTLEEDEFSCKQRLAYKLEQVHNAMQGEL